MRSATRDVACRSCGGTDLAPILSLGETPLANALLEESELAAPEPRFPLDLCFCNACALLQIEYSVDPELLFRDYPYFSSYSDTMLRHASELVSEVIADEGLGERSFVVEIASNDGYLLRNYLAAGVPALGIEPARNVAAVARRDHGIETLEEFFDAELAGRIRTDRGAADVIHMHNVLAHVPDLMGVVDGVRALLSPAGVAIIEVPYALDMIDRTEFDTIYHEHLCYFSLTAIEHLAERNELVVVDARRVAIHGGSLRVKLRHRGVDGAVSGRVATLRAEESRIGAASASYYLDFGRRVEALKTALHAQLIALKAEGKRIAAYGAAAKGSTLLNCAGIGTDIVDYVVDKNVHKQGRYMPGVHLLVHEPARLLEDRPDYVLILAWNLAEEIMEQQAEYRAAGGRFIVPVPTPTVH
jgi:SAM-dependent methyltransferase